MSYIALDIELQAIKYFLSKTLEAVDTEIAIISEREEAGEFLELDDFENELFFPMQREAIAIMAVFHEINALVEWELYSFASEPYRNAAEYKTTLKSIFDASSIDEVSRIKPVYTLPVRKVQKLIEEYYEIKLSDLPSFTEIQHVREAVNAFKHLRGFKDFRRYPDSKMGEKLQPTREDAYQAIDEAKVFLKTLNKECKRCADELTK